MKKMMVVLMMVLALTGLTGCQAKKTTEIYSYDEKTGEYVLEETKVEDIDGIFDEHVEMKFGPVIIEEVH